jgi:hypothetical protein
MKLTRSHTHHVHRHHSATPERMPSKRDIARRLIELTERGVIEWERHDGRSAWACQHEGVYFELYAGHLMHTAPRLRIQPMDMPGDQFDMSLTMRHALRLRRLASRPDALDAKQKAQRERAEQAAVLRAVMGEAPDRDELTEADVA